MYCFTLSWHLLPSPASMRFTRRSGSASSSFVTAGVIVRARSTAASLGFATGFQPCDARKRTCAVENPGGGDSRYGLVPVTWCGYSSNVWSTNAKVRRMKTDVEAGHASSPPEVDTRDGRNSAGTADMSTSKLQGSFRCWRKRRASCGVASQRAWRRKS